ncbi:LOW QUALITY PROTEIN: polymeric immunoglobulin receptor [Myxocyprinus asiaticus]|uniref:LOW QUALITY PROTEIN: polymeric immunoglobulin receptor n=1 Tax=Myxocyprinus asiaticus TaxID=70543 RepID=UPI002221BEBD|nr:LOW QUALITY PROTEIN: polymeric immunoglobulin receptor [Myxocyprinus asiaticus]
MIFLLILTIFVLDHLPGSLCTVTTVGDLTVLEGYSITVPCHYNPQYNSHVKYWCYGRMREFCSSLARTDDPESTQHGKGRATITDDPSQHVFTVTMLDPTEGDSGWYWCGVEVGGMWIADITASLYISVIQGVSVVSSMVNADEGNSVSVQCLYSKSLRSSEKRWCRSGSSNSCIVTDSDGTFSSKNVLIYDDRKSVFTVTLKQLEMRDSGWYWCAAGQQQVAVHVSVTPRATTPFPILNLKTTPGSPPLMCSNDSQKNRPFWESPLVVCLVILLITTVFLALWKLRQCYKKHKHRRTNEMSDKLTMCSWREGDYEHISDFPEHSSTAGANALTEITRSLHDRKHKRLTNLRNKEDYVVKSDSLMLFEGIVHAKTKNLSFKHPHVNPNL